jgi:hypothetical protein
LFIDRATQAGATFGDDQRKAIGGICVRLDGIPLAIELAAARARMMSPSQIAERLDQRFRLLTGGGRTAVERHRTLQATVSWSYELLDDTERSVFQRLSTFAGTFDLDAAEVVAAGGDVESFEVLDALGRLVDKSMVLTVPAAAGVRYRLLETLRQFAADRLAEQPDTVAVQDGHAVYFRDRAVTLGRATGGTDQNAVLDAIDADIDNYRSAFAHLLTCGQINEAARGVVGLDVYWQIRRTREGLRWYEQLLQHPELDTRRRIRALSGAARAAVHSGDGIRSEQRANEAVELADTAGVHAPWGAFEALMIVSMYRQDAAGYRRWWERGHEVAVAAGDPYLQLLARAQRGSVPGAWDNDELIFHHERLRDEVRQHGDPMLIFLSANSFSTVLYHAGQWERARAIADSAIEPARRAGPICHSAALGSAAALDALTEEADDRARANAAEGLRVALHEGLTTEALHVVLVAAMLAVQLDNVEVAATLLAGANHHADPLGVGGVSLVVMCGEGARHAVDAHSGDLSAARRRGETMTFDELVTYTLDTLA